MSTKLIGVRLPRDVMQDLERIANDRDISTNMVAKVAIKQWLDIYMPARRSNMIIIDKVFFNNILESLDKDVLEDFSSDFAINFRNFLRLQFGAKKGLDIKEFLPFLAKKLGSQGLLWLEHCEYQIKPNKYVTLKAIHSFVPLRAKSETEPANFPVLLTAVINHLMEELFDYVLVPEREYLSENTIELEFKPKYG